MDARADRGQRGRDKLQYARLLYGGRQGIAGIAHVWRVRTNALHRRSPHRDELLQFLMDKHLIQLYSMGRYNAEREQRQREYASTGVKRNHIEQRHEYQFRGRLEFGYRQRLDGVLRHDERLRHEHDKQFDRHEPYDQHRRTNGRYALPLESAKLQ